MVYLIPNAHLQNFCIFLKIVVWCEPPSPATADVGFTGDGPDGFLDGVNLNSTAGTTYNSLNAATAADTYSGGRYQAAEDTIDVKFVNAMDAGKYVVWCKFFKTNLN